MHSRIKSESTRGQWRKQCFVIEFEINLILKSYNTNFDENVNLDLALCSFLAHLCKLGCKIMTFNNNA